MGVWKGWASCFHPLRAPKSGFRAACRQQCKPCCRGGVHGAACSELTAWIAVIHLCMGARVWLFLAVFTHGYGLWRTWEGPSSHEAWTTACVKVSHRKFSGFFQWNSQARPVPFFLDLFYCFYNDKIVMKTSKWFFFYFLTPVLV